MLAAVTLLTVATAAQQGLQTVNSKYYIVHTDMDTAGVQEATLRITQMAEEYHRRTRGLSGSVKQRLPFYLFENIDNYHTAGGLPGSAGVFTGDRLMAYIDPRDPIAAWATVQHEGFHQFVAATIGGEIPLWANEGMAEYFSEAVWTGDGFITGLISPVRLRRIKAGLARDEFRTLWDMMTITSYDWIRDFSSRNYDQAWSMVHFLAHADDGKYEESFMKFLRAVSRNVEWRRAWKAAFGPDIMAFERRWREYWEAQPDDPTADLRAKAVTATLTSFYARALAQHQEFDDAAAFLAAAEAGELQMDERDWLPPALLATALRQAPDVGTWSLAKRRGWRWLRCKAPTGTTWEGRFKVRSRRVRDVDVAELKTRKRR